MNQEIDRSNLRLFRTKEPCGTSAYRAMTRDIEWSSIVWLRRKRLTDWAADFSTRLIWNCIGILREAKKNRNGTNRHACPLLSFRGQRLRVPNGIYLPLFRADQQARMPCIPIC